MNRTTFENRLNTIMEHNDYGESRTVTECNNIERWSPVDLILREYLNNGGGSAPGFLGISRRECIECYDYIMEHLEELISADMISERGWNNSGFPLWTNYNR